MLKGVSATRKGVCHQGRGRTVAAPDVGDFGAGVELGLDTVESREPAADQMVSLSWSIVIVPPLSGLTRCSVRPWCIGPDSRGMPPGGGRASVAATEVSGVGYRFSASRTPMSAARAAASRRLAAPSLARTAATWLSTVRTETTSWLAI